MKQHALGSKRGFTLIELLVVVAIIVILASGIMTVMFTARKDSRDTARMTTAEQIKLSVRLYKEADIGYPNYPTGTQLGIGRAIDAQLLPFLPHAIVDPLGAGNGYEYWYDSSFICTDVNQRIILIRKMELLENSNFNATCTHANRDVPVGTNIEELSVVIIN